MLINPRHFVQRPTMYKWLDKSSEAFIISSDANTWYWATTFLRVTKCSEQSNVAIIWSRRKTRLYLIEILLLWIWQLAKRFRYFIQRHEGNDLKRVETLTFMIARFNRRVSSSFQSEPSSSTLKVWVSISSICNFLRFARMKSRLNA